MSPSSCEPTSIASGLRRFLRKCAGCVPKNDWFGGWAAFKFCEMGFECDAIGIGHPSCQLEGVYGGDVVKLAGKVNCPVLFMPAKGDDPALYDNEKGTVVKALRANPKGKTSKTVYFNDMAHGFMTRGDETDEKIKRDVMKGMTMLVNWFAENGFGKKQE